MPAPSESPGARERRAEGGILIGNQIDKSRVGNPIARRLEAGIDAALLTLNDVGQPPPRTVHEVGCGEGRLSRRLRDHLGVPVRASDFSRELVAENQARLDPGIEYVVRSIYDLELGGGDGAELIVCCEVLEHVERPREALAALRRLGAPACILSVPREPLWGVLNFARGKYLGAFGNTPGHLNHWSGRSFASFLARGGFVVEQCLQPVPWTMVRGRFT